MTDNLADKVAGFISRAQAKLVNEASFLFVLQLATAKPQEA